MKYDEIQKPWQKFVSFKSFCTQLALTYLDFVCVTWNKKKYVILKGKTQFFWVPTSKLILANTLVKWLPENEAFPPHPHCGKGGGGVVQIF